MFRFACLISQSLARSLGCLVISFCKLRYNLECFAFKLIYYFNIRFSRNKPTSICLLSGDKGIRTLDPLLARQVLSQLSYTPIGIWQPPALPYRLQYSTIGRLGLNHRVRDENGCVPQAHRHQKCSYFGFLHRRCALRITTSSLSFFLIYLFGKSTVIQPLLLPFP